MGAIKFYPDIKIVKGYQRSVLSDLGKGEYIYVPNAIFDIWTNFDGKSIESIVNYYGKDNEPYINQYLSFLVDNKFIFREITNSILDLDELNLTWDYPALITNTILEIDTSQKVNIKYIIAQIEKLGCKDIQIRIRNNTNIKEVNNILKIFKKSSIKSIQLFVKYNSETNNNEQYKRLIDRSLRISELICYSAPENVITYKSSNGFGNVLFIKDNINERNNFGTIYSEHFQVNIQLFSESQNYNTYFNRKVAIDYEGNIKNCLNQKEIWGNINHTKIKSVIEGKGFKKFWTIHKDTKPTQVFEKSGSV